MIATARKTTPDDQTRAGMRWMCRHDLFALLRVLTSDRGASENLISDTLHREMCVFAQTTPYRENLYLVARGHLKTSIITVARNIQRILNNSQTRILIGSNKSENAEGMLADIKGRLELPILIWLFPDILVPDPAKRAEQWTTGAITVKRPRRVREGTIETIGETGEITSRHYDHATFDDMVGKQNYDTRDAREKTKKFLRDVRPLLDPGTSTIDYIGTTWHYDDAYSWLLEQQRTGLRDLGAFIRACWTPDPEGVETPYGPVRLSYPEKFTIAELLKIRGQGISEFAAQYLIDPLPSDTAYFPSEAMRPFIVPKTECPPRDELWTVMAVDPAISVKNWADFSALATVGFDPHGTMWILDLRRGRWAESALVQHIFDAYQRAGGAAHVRTIGFEAIGFAKIYRWLFTQEGERRGFYLPVHGLERDTKITKNTRIRALEPWWSNGEIRILSECPALAEFLDEAEKWRPDRENTHDDLLDAVVDTLQMRVRPDVATPERAFEDPETADRAVFEQSLIEQRAGSGQPPLDHGELRMQWFMRKRRQRMDEEREAMAGTSAMGEW